MLIRQRLPQELVLRLVIHERPINKEIPRRRVEAIHGTTGNEESSHSRGLVHTERTQGGILQYRECILATIDQVREGLSGIVVPSNTLEKPYDARYGLKEAK